MNLRIWTILFTSCCAWLLVACDAHPEEPGHHEEAAHAHEHEGEAAHEHEGEAAHAHEHEAAHEHEGEAAHEHEGEAAHEHEGEGAHEHADEAGHEHAGEEMGIKAAALEALPGVRIGPVTQSAHASVLKIPGRVRVDPDRRVSVSAPVGARIQTLDAPPHATVSAGQRLAWLQLIDTDIRHQQIKAVELRAQLLAAETKRDRTRSYAKALQSKGAVVATELARVRADLGVAEAQVRSRASALQAVLASLRLAGLSTAQVAALEREGKVVTHISLKAPKLADGVDWEVAARPVHAGQTVAAGALLFELVALDRLQVVGEAFEADLEVVRRAAKEQLPVDLLFPASRERVEGLHIFTVESALDSASAGLTHFFLWLPNRVAGEKTEEGQRYLDWQHRAGARVQVLVSRVAPSPRIVLPASAVVREQGRHFVFRMDADGDVRRLAVNLEQLDERQAVVMPDAALHVGERVVLQGALQVQLAIKQKTQPQAAGGHRGHNH